MDTRRTKRFLPLVAFAMWQAVAGLGYGQVQEARTWIEGMT